MSVRPRAGLAAALGALVAYGAGASAQHHHRHRHHEPATEAPAAQDTAPAAATPAAPQPAPAAAAPATPPPAPQATRAAPAPAPAARRATPAAGPSRVVVAPAHDDAVAVAPAIARRPVALDVALGIRAVSRHLGFYEDLGAQFQPYDLWIAPAAAAAIEWFPGAHFTRGVLAHIGVYAAGDYLFGLSSRDGNGNTYDVTAYQFGGGLRLRIPLPLGGSEIGILAGYNHQTFTNQPSTLTAATTYVALSTTYQALRAGLSLRLELGPRVALLASGGALDVLSVGEAFSGYFPRATVGAVDASLGVAFMLGAGFEARGVLDARRYFYAMNPNPGDMYIVGGALDHYLDGTLYIAWRH